MPVSFDSRFQVAKKDIVKAIAKLPTRVLTAESIRFLLLKHRDFWRIGNVSFPRFLELLMEHADLRVVRLEFPNRPFIRYCWGDVPHDELVQSISSSGYFSHYTAMQHHGLSVQIPKVTYFNIEQRVSPGGGTLSQVAIDRTFKGKCRTSSNVAILGERSICLLNGGNTENLGVAEAFSPEGSAKIRVTNIERTLIDATVRPVYSGGVFEVLGAYRAALEQVSVNKMASYLKAIGYTYPYHQAIGFYLERAGYREPQLALLRKFPREFDFYLDYGLKNPEFDSRWRIFYPQGF